MVTIAVIGSVNLDIVAMAPKLPRPGETVTGATLHHFPGGKGANQALAAQRLGADVTLVACVGDDTAADEALALLREGGVDLSPVTVSGTVPGTVTGTALIAVEPGGENQIVVAPGANAQLTPERVRVPGTDAVICQLEVPADTIAHVAQFCEGFLCVNLAPARHVDVSILQRADLIVVNQTESDWYGDTLSACAGLIATTRGAGVATLRQGGTVIAEASPPRVDAVDATGAGDTFTAALTVALVEGQAPQAALEFACTAAAIAATRIGAQPSLPHREEVDARV